MLQKLRRCNTALRCRYILIAEKMGAARRQPPTLFPGNCCISFMADFAAPVTAKNFVLFLLPCCAVGYTGMPRGVMGLKGATQRW